MSGIVAIVSGDRSITVAQAELEDLAVAYEAVRGRGRRYSAGAEGYVGLIKIAGENDEASGIVIDKDSWVAFSGSIFPDPSATTEPRDVDGQFSFFRYDAKAGEFTAASDPMGMYALYWADAGGKTYFSTSALALAKHLGAKASALALQAFVLSGYHFGTLTHWESIERVDPGTQFTFTGGAARRERYWQPQIDRSVESLKFERAVSHSIDAITSSLQETVATAGDTWSDLTGGFDSRLMNVLLDSAGVAFTGTTRDTPTVEDIDLARRLSDIAGWNWLHTRLPDNWHEVLPVMIPIALGWADANLEVSQLARVLYPHKQLALEKTNLISSGGGEHWQFYAWKSEFLRAGRSTNVNFDNFIDFGMIRPIDLSIFRSDPSADVRADFRARLRSYVSDYTGERNTAQLDLLYAYKCMGHFGAYASSDAAYLTAHLPFYFKPIFTTAFSSNFRYRNSHRLPRHIIERLNPEVAALPTTRGGPAQPWRVTNVHRSAPYYGVLARKAVNKISHKMIGKTLWALPPPTWPWESATTNTILDWLGREEPFDHAHLRSGALYDERKLNALFAAAREPTFTNTPLLGRVITVELALREVGATLAS